MMILFNNSSGEFGANARFAFFGNGNNVNCVLHGKRSDGDGNGDGDGSEGLVYGPWRPVALEA